MELWYAFVLESFFFFFPCLCICFSKIKENKNNLSKNVIFQINFGGANPLINLLVLDSEGGDSLPIAEVVNLGGRLVGCGRSSVEL